jgi:hypothetical protein
MKHLNRPRPIAGKLLMAACVLLVSSQYRSIAGETEFRKSTQILLIATSNNNCSRELGLAADLSFLPHLTGSMTAAYQYIPLLPDCFLLRTELLLKFFFRPDNLGFYASIGPSFYTTLVSISPDYLRNQGLFFSGVGVKARLFRFLMLELNCSVPSSLLLEYSEELLSEGFVRIALGVCFGG